MKNIEEFQEISGDYQLIKNISIPIPIIENNTLKGFENKMCCQNLDSRRVLKTPQHPFPFNQ